MTEMSPHLIMHYVKTCLPYIDSPAKEDLDCTFSTAPHKMEEDLNSFKCEAWHAIFDLRNARELIQSEKLRREM